MGKQILGRPLFVAAGPVHDDFLHFILADSLIQVQAMVSINVTFDRKLNSSDIENSPRSTSAGGASTPSTTSSPRQVQSPENLPSEHEALDRKFEAMEADMADCETEAALPMAGLSA